MTNFDIVKLEEEIKPLVEHSIEMLAEHIVDQLIQTDFDDKAIDRLAALLDDILAKSCRTIQRQINEALNKEFV